MSTTEPTPHSQVFVTGEPFIQPQSIHETVTDDGATVSYHFLIDGVPEVFVGKARRDPRDAPNTDIARCLANGRALSRAGKVLTKRANGYVKHADDIQARNERDQAVTREGLLADAAAHERTHLAHETARRALAEAVAKAERRRLDQREDNEQADEQAPAEQAPKSFTPQTKERIRKTLRFARSIGATRTADAGAKLLDAVDEFNRASREELTRG